MILYQYHFYKIPNLPQYKPKNTLNNVLLTSSLIEIQPLYFISNHLFIWVGTIRKYIMLRMIVKY